MPLEKEKRLIWEILATHKSLLFASSSAGYFAFLVLLQQQNQMIKAETTDGETDQERHDENDTMTACPVSEVLKTIYSGSIKLNYS